MPALIDKDQIAMPQQRSEELPIRLRGAGRRVTGTTFDSEDRALGLDRGGQDGEADLGRSIRGVLPLERHLDRPTAIAGPARLTVALPQVFGRDRAEVRFSELS